MTTSLADIRARAERLSKAKIIEDISETACDVRTVSFVQLPKLIANDIEKLLKIVEIQSEALNYYLKMKVICKHDDSSWCDHCPDGGYRARKALKKADDVLGEK